MGRDIIGNNRVLLHPSMIALEINQAENLSFRSHLSVSEGDRKQRPEEI